LTELDRAALDAAVTDFETALTGVPEGPADEMLRAAMRRMVDAAHHHTDLLESLMVESAGSNTAALVTLSARLLGPANDLFRRIKKTGELRPISDVIVARTILSLFMGIVISERAMPQAARVFMRLFPERAWVDGMVDVMIYGLLEDDAR